MRAATGSGPEFLTTDNTDFTDGILKHGHIRHTRLRIMTLFGSAKWFLRAWLDPWHP
jgi:hypothetical protein